MASALHKEITSDYYRTTANRGHTDDHQRYHRSADGLKRRLCGWLPSNRNAVCLDLACGCGELLYLLEREGFEHLNGVDLCDAELQEAGKKVRAHLSCDDIATYLEEAESSSVDFISALNILEHLPQDSLHKVLREASRVLKPGGTFVAMVPNAISPFGTMTRYWDMTHLWSFTPNNFRQLAALTGFDSEIEFRECGPVPYGFKSSIRYAAWQLIRIGIAAWLLIEVADRKDGIYTADMLVRMQRP